MAKNILRRQFGNMYGDNKPYHTPEPLPNKLPPIEPPLFSLTGIILFTIALILIVGLYLNRERAYSVGQRIYSQFAPLKGLDMVEQKYHELTKGVTKDDSKESKQNTNVPNTDVSQNVLKTETQDNIESKEKKKEETIQKESDGGVKKLEEKINRYSNEQTVKKSGFCYIGYDKERVCTNVIDGDICMSGQIFPTMDVCLNPHLRP